MNKLLISVIESSSQASCINISDQKTNIFLDFGVKSTNDIDWFFNHTNLNKPDLVACLLTHGHINHIRMVGRYQNLPKIKYYCTDTTKSEINKKYNGFLNQSNCFVINDSLLNQWIKIENSNWKFKAIKTIHNILGSLCFVIKNQNKSILYLTDTEYFENKNFKNLSCYIIESNYGSDYIHNRFKFNKHLFSVPFHMNIDRAWKLFEKFKGFKTKLVLFCHLSVQSKPNLTADFTKQNFGKIQLYSLDPFIKNKQKFFL